MEEKKISKFTTFTVLSLAFVWTFEGSTMAPALGEIDKAFPGASVLQLQNIIVIPFLTAFIFSIISGKLAKYIDKKTIAIVGLAIYGSMGILPVIAASVNQILLLRLIIGVGAGLILPLANAYIAELYSEERRGRFLGAASSISQLSNFVMSLIVGAILFLGWKAPFYTYLILFVMMACVILSIPKTHTSTHDNYIFKNYSAKKERLTLRHYWYTLLMFMLWVLGPFITTNLALWMTAEKLGESWMIGVIISVCAAGAAIAGFIWTYMQKVFKRYFAAFALVVFASGFLVFYYADSPLLITFGVLFIGLGQGMLTPHVFDLTAQHSTSIVQKDMAFGLVSSALTFGSVATPVFQQFLILLNPNAASPYRYKFLCAAMILYSGALISVFMHGKKTQISCEEYLKSS